MDKRLSILLSLITDDNDFQLEQAAAAQEVARQLGVNLEIVYADSDSVTQSQQLLKAIQGPQEARPDAILFEPVGGTALPQVANAAMAAGIGWAVLNRDATYLSDLRRSSKVPAFSVSSDHREIGRLQNRQLAALLPGGGTILYVQGPTESFAAQQRTAGMQETKSANIHLSMLKGQWTEGSAYKTVCSWLRLSTTLKARVDAVVAHNDAMALGARKAIEAQIGEKERESWLRIPFLGVDGLPKTGQSWVRTGLLTATIVVPANTAPALETMVHGLQNHLQPPERKYIAPRSFPTVEELASARAEKAASSRPPTQH